MKIAIIIRREGERGDEGKDNLSKGGDEEGRGRLGGGWGESRF